MAGDGRLAVLRAAAAHVLVAAADLDELAVGDDVEHHLGRVLRLRDGELVTVTDGAGRWRSTRYVAAGETTLEPDGDIETVPSPPSPLTIATAIPKGDRVDWLVQKVTELGADRVVLVHADRSVVRWRPERERRQVDRLQRIADEATRQSRRVWRTEVVAPVRADEILPTAAVAEPGGMALDPSERTVAVGPEGGWTDRELALAGSCVDLGPHVLRTETAAVAVVARCVATTT